MTREELVKQKAQEFTSSGEFSPTLTECFIAGAEWEHKRLVEKASEWLGSIDFDMKYWNPEEGVCVGDFIEDLRKVMEE
jgi:hypothetical protein